MFVPNTSCPNRRIPWEDTDLITFRERHRSLQLRYKSSPTAANKLSYCVSAREFSELYNLKYDTWLEQECDEIMKLHDCYMIVIINPREYGKLLIQ